MNIARIWTTEYIIQIIIVSSNGSFEVIPY
jgi:hypothetical protein